jgi:predicted small lipoprotein YifL
MIVRVSPEQSNLCMVRRVEHDPHWFSEKIMLKQKDRAGCRLEETSSRSSGDFVVISNYRPTSSGWAIILLSVTALALGGCGRKGGLDLPPNAGSSAAVVGDTETERAAQPGVFNPSYGADAGPTAPKIGKKPFILDPLLGN